MQIRVAEHALVIRRLEKGAVSIARFRCSWDGRRLTSKALTERMTEQMMRYTDRKANPLHGGMGSRVKSVRETRGEVMWKMAYTSEMK